MSHLISESVTGSPKKVRALGWARSGSEKILKAKNQLSHFCIDIMAGKTTVKKKFKCEFCDELFSSKSCQETHIQNIHNPTGVIYKCGICGKSQALKGNLKHHLKRSMGTKPTFVNIVENHLHVLHL